MEVCTATAAECQCTLTVGHYVPHECASYCGAQWEGNWEDDTFVIVKWPSGRRVL